VSVGVHTTVISPPSDADTARAAGPTVESIPTVERQVLAQRTVELPARTVVIRAVALRPDDPEPRVAQRCPDEACDGYGEGTKRIDAHLDRLEATYRA
jgi:hypothetical protein